jgi:protein-disulfide isomerase
MNFRRIAPLALALAVAGGVGWWFAGPSSAPQLPTPVNPAGAQTADGDQRARVPDMRKGSAEAPVTVIEYASFTCPHCANFHRSVFPQLQAEFVETGQVQWIKREVYFDRPGLWAAMLARCGDDSRYFPMVDLIYETQRDWSASSDPAAIAENLRRLGRRTGLTDDEVNACLMDAEQAQAMVAVYQQNAGEHGITSTPSFVIDGELHSNMGLEAFRTIISGRLGG